MNRKAVALFSGGLDSMLAIKLMLEQGIEVQALNFFTPFCANSEDANKKKIEASSKILGVKCHIIKMDSEFMDMMDNQKFGTGKGMNPCIDCRILSFKKAKEYMEQIGADFIITGEVLGQRPMSQRRNAMDIIDKEAHMKGIIVRPLCGKLLEPTEPEKNGLIDRAKLCDISGRSRKVQMELAKQFNITEYPIPAGGCLLTNVEFSKKVKDLFDHIPDYRISDVHLLKVGRQFRIHDGLKLFVGRDERENELLLSFLEKEDHVLDVPDVPSPIALLRGEVKEKDLELAASILARYSDNKQGSMEVSYKIVPEDTPKFIDIAPAEEELIVKYRIS